MDFADFVSQPCKNKTGWEFVPRKEGVLDLGKAAKALRERGIELEAETPVVLMLKADGASISLFRSGKILVKHRHSEAEALPLVMPWLKLV